MASRMSLMSVHVICILVWFGGSEICRLVTWFWSCPTSWITARPRWSWGASPETQSGVASWWRSLAWVCSAGRWSRDSPRVDWVLCGRGRCGDPTPSSTPRSSWRCARIAPHPPTNSRTCNTASMRGPSTSPSQWSRCSSRHSNQSLYDALTTTSICDNTRRLCECSPTWDNR